MNWHVGNVICELKQRQFIFEEILCLLPSACVAIVTLWIMTSQAKFAFSVILFFLTYFITRCYYNKRASHVSLHPSFIIQFPSWLVLPLLTLFSVFAIKIVPPIEVSYLNWWQIPLANYVRALAAFLIVSLIPGYFILDLLDTQHNLGKLEKFVFAYIISIFISCSAVYFLLVISRTFLPSFVLILTIFLTLLHIFRFLWSRSKQCGKQRVTIKISLPQNFCNITVLLLVFMFICIGLFSIFSSNYSLIHDLIPDHGQSVMITRNVIPSYFNPFQVYLALIFSLSGSPILNMHILLNFSNLILIIAFFLMTTAFFKDPKLSVIATVFFVVCGGFGGILVAYNYATVNIFDEYSRQMLLNKVNMETLLDMRYAYYTPFLFFTHMWWGFVATFASLYLLKKNDNSHLTQFLITVSIALGYLAHRVEVTIFFIVLLVTVFLTSKASYRTYLRRCSLSGIAGLIVGFTVVCLTPGGLNYGIYDLYLVFGLVFLALVPLLVSLTRFSLSIEFPNKATHKTLFYISAFYLVGLSFIVWNEMRPEIIRNFGAIYSRGLVPWFFYPLLLGPLGIIAFLAIPHLLGENKGNEAKNVSKLVLLTPLIIVFFGRFLTLLNAHLDSPLPFWETRTIYWVRIFAAIISAYIVGHMFLKLRCLVSNVCMRRLIIGCMIALLAISGVSSTLVRIDYWERFSKFGLAGEGETVVPANELKAMDYLRFNAPPYGQVLTLTDKSWTRLKYYAGIPNIFHRPEVIFDASCPEFVFQTLSALQVKYIYLTPRDFAVLHERYGEGFIAQHLIHYLPIAFNNSGVVIYEVPQFSLPSASDFALLIPQLKEFKGGDLEDWHLRSQSGTIKNMSTISDKGILTLSGSLNSTMRDFYLLDMYLGQTSTDDYPYLAVRWRSTDYCAMLEVRYTDGTYLTSYAHSQITSRFLPDWTVTTIEQPLNKTVEYIIIGVDDRAKTSVAGFQTVQFDYIMLYSPSSAQYAFPISLLAASTFNYTVVSDRDPNCFNYETLILPHDLMAYDLVDDFTTDSHLWAVISGKWLFKDGELHQVQTQPYVDAVVCAGDSTWSDYVVEAKVKAEGDFIDDACLQFRFKDRRSTYDFRIKSNLVRIGKWVNGSWVELDRKTDYKIMGDTWYKLRVSINGSNIMCFIDDVLVFNITDSTFKQGGIALMAEGIPVTFDYVNVVTLERLNLLNEYIKWIENGSQVVVLGGSNLGFFASLMNIDLNGEAMIDGISTKNSAISVPQTSIPVLYSKSPDVRAVANYTREDVSASSFALCKYIGSGKLIYVNFEHILRIINNAPNDLKWNLLKQIGSLIGALLNVDISTNNSNQYWTYEVVEGMKLGGLIKINSDHLPFPLINIKARYLDLASTKYHVTDDLESESAIISNVTIQNFKVQGSTNSTLTTTHVQSSPLGYGPYLALDFLEEFEWVLELGKDTLMTMEIVRDDLSTYNITVQEGVIKVKSMPTTLFVRSPIIHVQGETLFDKAYIGWIGSSHPVKSEGYPFKIEGNASLNVEYLDGNMVLISALNFNGTAIVYSPPIPSWNEWDIPWSKILVSPYHLLLLGATVTLVVNKRILKIRKIKLKLKSMK